MKSTSPLPKKKIENNMSFSQAITEVVLGKKITKLEWKDEQFYGMLKDELLVLHKPDGKFYQWIISEADLQGTDFIVIN